MGAQQVEVLVVKPEDLSFIAGTHLVEDDTHALRPAHTNPGTYANILTLTPQPSSPSVPEVRQKLRRLEVNFSLAGEQWNPSRSYKHTLSNHKANLNQSHSIELPSKVCDRQGDVSASHTHC